jgi:hypothetical protein
MNRKPIVFAIAATTLTSAAALAQYGPDFSPMRPDNLAPPQPQAQVDAPVTTDNRMLDAYAASAAPLPGESGDSTSAYSQPAYASQPGDTPHRAPRIEPPRQSTIGNGLFDRRGPNDFGQ